MRVSDAIILSAIGAAVAGIMTTLIIVQPSNTTVVEKTQDRLVQECE